VNDLESELERARDLPIGELADAIESIGFECTRCGACCTAEDDDPHTATVFPDEVRELQGADLDAPPDDDGSGGADDAADRPQERDWRDVARPMPYGLSEGSDGSEGETFEWALQTDGCGDCTFYAEDEDGTGSCLAHGDRPLVCRTYPFSVALGGTSQPMGEAVDSVALEGQGEAGEAGNEAGMVRAHECEGLGRDIDRADAEELAAALKERAIRELSEAIAVRDEYAPAEPAPGEVVVQDSEGAKRPDGSPR
jgi:Fe-S-cluster containining protein